MSLISQALQDIKDITSNLNDFGVEFDLISPANVTTAMIGVHTKHHLGLNTDGVPVNSKTASLAFSEGNLPIGVSVRNVAGEVKLKGWRINVKDSTGGEKQYIIREWFPDEMIGLIVCILGDFE